MVGAPAKKCRAFTKAHRDKLKGTNGTKVFFFFLLIFADFRFSWKLHFGGADFRRKPQETADFRRNPQETADFRRNPQETGDFRRNPFVPFVPFRYLPKAASIPAQQQGENTGPRFVCFGAAPHLEQMGKIARELSQKR